MLKRINGTLIKMDDETLHKNYHLAKKFNKWLAEKGFTKASEERYTVQRQYLYEVFLKEQDKQ